MRTTKRHSGAAAWWAGLLLAMLACHCPLGATTLTKADADSAYARGQYQQAIKDYEALLAQGVSADLYYNLGNAYYRSENITRAVLNYERALLLSPGDRDIRHNLQMARSKTIDKITPESEMFFITWYRSLVNLMSVDAWARTALVTASAATVKSTPAKSGTDLFVLHEGTKVTILDDAMKEWRQVRVADGRQGWLETRQMENI